jgi:hypothetical protein
MGHEGAGVVTTRGDVHYVATEYGVAYLHGKSIRQRVLDLINIAHPKFRKGLIQAAKARNYIYQDQIELAWDQVNYPEELEHYTTLRDGTEIFFRPIKPVDEAALSEMLYSLSEESVRTRYMTRTMTFPHKDIQQLTNIDYKNDLAIVGWSRHRGRGYRRHGAYWTPRPRQRRWPSSCRTSGSRRAWARFCWTTSRRLPSSGA